MQKVSHSMAPYHYVSVFIIGHFHSTASGQPVSLAFSADRTKKVWWFFISPLVKAATSQLKQAKLNKITTKKKQGAIPRILFSQPRTSNFTSRSTLAGRTIKSLDKWGHSASDSDVDAFVQGDHPQRCRLLAQVSAPERKQQAWDQCCQLTPT